MGTYQSFLEKMTAALCQGKYPALRRLKTRSSQDSVMAWLDAWAIVADVLTFYQERIANEGYLRTAVQSRSICELASLIGYKPRPGVAASAFLAYTLEKPRDSAAAGMESSAPVETVIPAGTRAQTVPKPGELPQTFETAEELRARPDWNELVPRKTRPQWIIDYYTSVLYLKGTATNLKPNDRLIVVFPGEQPRAPWKIQTVEPDEENKRTKVTIQNVDVEEEVSQNPELGHDSAATASVLTGVTKLFEPLTKAPARHPFRSADLQRSISRIFDPTKGDAVPRILSHLRRDVGQSLYVAMKNANVTEENKVKVYALRISASPFGHNAPRKPVLDDKGVPVRTEEWPLFGTVRIKIVLSLSPPQGLESFTHEPLTTEGTIVLSDKYETVSYQFKFPLTDPRISPDTDMWRVTAHSSLESRFPLYEFDILQQAQAPAFHRQVKVVVQANIIVVTIDDRSIKVGVGQSMTSSKSGETTSVSRDENVVTIVNEARLQPSEDDRKLLGLDAAYDQITPSTNRGDGGWVVIERPDKAIITQIESVRRISKADYGISARVTELKLKADWMKPEDGLLSDIRGTAIYAQSESLELSEEPVLDDVEKAEVELDTIYSGLESGRWMIVEGERTDIEGTAGVKDAELVMLANVTQEFISTLPDDKLRTHLHFSPPLKYSYKRDTVTIYGNVVRATHGETRKEVLGGGDGSKTFQQFTVKQSPLTYVPSPTPSGVTSSLEIRVNNVLWHETESFVGMGTDDRAYLTKTDESDKTSIVFGNGTNGARVPTGSENVEARYRTGIGKVGNVDAQQISLLGDRPLGVKAVINPLRSSGGANPESDLNVRRNAPIGVVSLDRLVSVQDYADFARTFAGVGKASAVEVVEGASRLVHLTIAGVDDIPIDETSELYRNLKLSLLRNGDPHLPIQIDSREVLFIVIAAKVRVNADYLWSSVSSSIRNTLLEIYSFDRREFGQDVFLSDVISNIQAIEGVEFVDVDVLDKVEEPKNYADRKQVEEDLEDLEEDLKRIARSGGEQRVPHERITVNLASRSKKTGVLRPAQLAYLNGEIQDTLILTELK
jgi:predicted phage baseplate assembly protein